MSTLKIIEVVTTEHVVQISDEVENPRQYLKEAVDLVGWDCIGTMSSKLTEQVLCFEDGEELYE